MLKITNRTTLRPLGQSHGRVRVTRTALDEQKIKIVLIHPIIIHSSRSRSMLFHSRPALRLPLIMPVLFQDLNHQPQQMRAIKILTIVKVEVEKKLATTEQSHQHQRQQNQQAVSPFLSKAMIQTKAHLNQPAPHQPLSHKRMSVLPPQYVLVIKTPKVAAVRVVGSLAAVAVVVEELVSAWRVRMLIPRRAGGAGKVAATRGTCQHFPAGIHRRRRQASPRRRRLPRPLPRLSPPRCRRAALRWSSKQVVGCCRETILSRKIGLRQQQQLVVVGLVLVAAEEVVVEVVCQQVVGRTRWRRALC